MTSFNMNRRTMLFVPGDRFDRISKSAELQADSIVLDLEDSVALSNKELARNSMAKALLELDFKGKEIVVRINSPRTLLGIQDISFLSSLTCFPNTIIVPKVESKGEIMLVASLLEEINPEIRIIPLLESANGIFEAKNIATASHKINGLIFGGGDLSGELGCQME
ncbi:MAG: HpcH/HpaI aldolase/citrate lyase family protein, partial [Clostridia bacterium]|nr:HpcH/HpaI aldolase/citrate lyase family protein [Clostridia bacterium]